jgi:carbon storage regulator
MLILTRRCNETIRIGDDIEVTVMAIDRGQIRIGITAPKHVRVDRQEVRERIDAGIPAPCKANP